jgi:hypothetical protein
MWICVWQNSQFNFSPCKDHNLVKKKWNTGVVIFKNLGQLDLHVKYNCTWINILGDGINCKSELAT